ncbi:sulfatase [Microbacterium suaedae]|uniref:sulfatase family protein n=1 Tax=Microbacterium suaedae TaxID=2067813 RepID=UPI000DA138B8|nr:sulfatase [Microbacterium suaedae]
MATTPNIVWISTHDINPHLGAYEGAWPQADQVRTPRIDALAREGVRFDQAFAAAPVCAPARSAIMTGCYPVSVGTMHMRTKAVPPPEIRLVSEYFREAGYYTTNNWFTDFQVETPPTAFDDCSGSAHWRDRPEGTPFFAAFHSLITHESRIYGDDPYENETRELPDEVRRDPADVEFPPYHPDTAAFRRAWARYYDLIAAMDAWVGRILDELEEDGLAENTLVIFWSDHGASFPRAKRWANEAGLRVPLIARWPGRLEAGAAREDVVQTMDLAPTVLEAAGLPIPEHMHGTPLFAADGAQLDASPYAFGARDRMDAQEDTVRTVRDDRYRYTLNLHPDRSGMQYNYYPDHLDTWGELRRLVHEEGQQLALGEAPSILTPLQRSIVAVPRPEEELFDIRADPHETTNLVDDPAHREARDRLRAALDAWREEHGDLGAMPERELLEDWRPNGAPRPTAAPTISLEGGAVTASCATPGASIAWTTTPPSQARPLTAIEEQTGSPRRDGRRWNLYTGAFVAPPGSDIWLGAWRLGYSPSVEVHVPATEGRA